MVTVIGLAVTATVVLPVPLAATAATGPVTIWVDPVHGQDTRTGAGKATAVRTLTEAWNRIPARKALTRPVRIMVRAGTIAESAAPNYWEQRRGTAAAPISIVSADGVGRAQLPSINMFGVSHLTLDGVAIRSRFDAFHCERCSYITLKRSAFTGIGDPLKGAGPQEGVKINQSDHMQILDSYLAGATDNALDLVAVQHATIARNTIAHSADWCAYAKGGSADVVFDSNEVHHCGTGGITAGQGTGLQFMVAPWTNYEAYGVRMVNNVLHDVEGAALGVNGGFAVLLAGNTAYRTGSRDHVLEVVFGERSCDGTGEDDARCTAQQDAGAWGPAAAGGDPTPIGNSQVALIGNLVVNPDGIRSEYTQFAVYGPRTADPAEGPDPAVTDDRLTIRGNAIWNGPGEVALGLGDDQGCTDENPTCTVDLVQTQNAINTVKPDVTVAAGVAPVPASVIATGVDPTIPAFSWDGVAAARGVPPVTMPTVVERDRAGRIRADAPTQPGAYVGPAAVTTVAVTGTGSGGRVTARGGTLSLLRGGWVELAARPATGRAFAAWGGACAGQRGATCLLRADRAQLAVSITWR
jgi:hypothetical protein